MSAIIAAANGAGTTSPLTVLSPWTTSWQSRNIVHDLIGGSIAVSLVGPRPRSGVMELLYELEADAFDCAELHREETTFTLTESDRPAVSMSYVIDGSVTVSLDPDTLEMWVVSVGYQGIE